MPTIYEQHDAAFAHVSAHVVLKDGERVATIAFKYPRDGAGRLYAYVHWLGTEMVRGHASGGGYDKHSAACASAASRMARDPHGSGTKSKAQSQTECATFIDALATGNGRHWDRRLADTGFTVLQAV